MNFDSIGGRRYVLAWGVLVIDSVLLACKALDSGSYTAIVLGIVTGYMGANVAQRHIEAKKDAAS